MKRFQLRLAWLLWLVAIVAAFLGGMRYGEYRQAARRRSVAYKTTNITSPPSESAEFLGNAKLFTAPIGFSR